MNNLFIKALLRNVCGQDLFRSTSSCRQSQLKRELLCSSSCPGGFRRGQSARKYVTLFRTNKYCSDYFRFPPTAIKSRGIHSSISFYQNNFNKSEYTKHKPPFLLAEQHLDKIAIVDCNGSFSYFDLLCRSMVLNADILQTPSAVEDKNANGQRIALLTDQDVSYVVGQFATWMSGGTCVPLCTSHPVSEWRYFLEDSGSSLLLVGERFADQISPVAKELGIAINVLPRIDKDRTDVSLTLTDDRWIPASGPNQSRSKILDDFKEKSTRWLNQNKEFIWEGKPALIVYTSGTTGRPKGVVLTHGNLSAMIFGMIRSWAWTSQDMVLHVLPLHHIHGIVNVLLTPLACGATCVMEPKFDARQTWNLLTSPSIPGLELEKGINMFMAVPTVYAKMIQHYEEHIECQGSEKAASAIRDVLKKNIRLMVSGSAALPQPVSDRWLEVTGHRLLERYGMTEIGMALTNPLHGERIVGAVGNPFPDVSVRIVQSNDEAPLGFDILAEGDHQHTTVTPGCENKLGELLVKGPNVFSQYWNKVKATTEAFTDDGWFRTGDTAVYQDGVYRIVGRTSVDIIKSGGYKISALDVERHLLAHPQIIDVAVVGLPDDTWGQKVAAVVTTKEDNPLDLQDLRHWANDHLPSYQIPTVLKCLPAIPRNAMGKVNKKELVIQVFPEYAHQ